MKEILMQSLHSTKRLIKANVASVVLVKIVVIIINSLRGRLLA